MTDLSPISQIFLVSIVAVWVAGFGIMLPLAHSEAKAFGLSLPRKIGLYAMVLAWPVFVALFVLYELIIARPPHI